MLDILNQLQPEMLVTLLSAFGGLFMSLYHKLPLLRQKQILDFVRQGVLHAEEVGKAEGITGEQKKSLATDVAQGLAEEMGYKVNRDNLGNLVDSTVQAIYNFEKEAEKVQTPIGFTPTPVVVSNSPEDQ